jgi:tetrahydromethanopterin S-methyltransferase subunit G
MAIDLEKEVKDLKRRVDLAETRLSQLEGQFGFISAQLRDIQLYMHARFDDIDQKIDGLRNELPQIVASAVGAVMREHGND